MRRPIKLLWLLVNVLLNPHLAQAAFKENTPNRNKDDAEIKFAAEDGYQLKVHVSGLEAVPSWEQLYGPPETSGFYAQEEARKLLPPSSKKAQDSQIQLNEEKDQTKLTKTLSDEMRKLLDKLGDSFIRENHEYSKEFWDILAKTRQLKSLEDRKKVLNVKDSQGKAALIAFAPHRKWTDLAQEYIRAGASVNLPEDEMHNTPLISAIVLENPELVKVYLANGAHIETMSDGDLTPLRAAVQKSNFPILSMLFKHNVPYDPVVFEPARKLAKENSESSDIKNPKKCFELIKKMKALNKLIQKFLQAASENDLADFFKEVNKLSDADKKYVVNAHARDGYTLLGWVIDKMVQTLEYRQQTIETLLKAGANPDHHFFGQEPPLFSAIKNDVWLMNKLFEYNADPNVLGKDGKTALMRLAASGCKPCSLTLLGCKEAGAKIKLNLDATDSSGNTALMYCAKGGNDFLLQKLLVAGADYQSVNLNNENAVDLAKKGKTEGHKNCVKFLEGEVRKSEKKPLVAVPKSPIEQLGNQFGVLLQSFKNLAESESIIKNKEKWENAFRAHLEKARQIQSLQDRKKILDRKYEGMGALVILASYDFFAPLIRELIAGGATVDLVDDNFGMTGLLVASMSGNLNNVRVFLEHKANVNVRDKNGNSLLASIVGHGFVNILQVLVEHNLSYDPVAHDFVRKLASGEIKPREIAGTSQNNIRDYKACLELLNQMQVKHENSNSSSWASYPASLANWSSEHPVLAIMVLIILFFIRNRLTNRNPVPGPHIASPLVELKEEEKKDDFAKQKSTLEFSLYLIISKPQIPERLQQYKEKIAALKQLYADEKIKFDINFEFDLGDLQKVTPIILAAKSSQNEILGELIKEKANVNAVDNVGISVVRLTITNDNSAGLVLLISADAKINISDYEFALQNDKEKCAKILFEKFKPDLLGKLETHKAKLQVLNVEADNALQQVRVKTRDISAKFKVITQEEKLILSQLDIEMENEYSKIQDKLLRAGMGIPSSQLQIEEEKARPLDTYISYEYRQREVALHMDFFTSQLAEMQTMFSETDRFIEKLTELPDLAAKLKKLQDLKANLIDIKKKDLELSYQALENNFAGLNEAYYKIADFIEPLKKEKFEEKLKSLNNGFAGFKTEYGVLLAQLKELFEKAQRKLSAEELPALLTSFRDKMVLTEQLQLELSQKSEALKAARFELTTLSSERRQAVVVSKKAREEKKPEASKHNNSNFRELRRKQKAAKAREAALAAVEKARQREIAARVAAAVEANEQADKLARLNAAHEQKEGQKKREFQQLATILGSQRAAWSGEESAAQQQLPRIRLSAEDKYENNIRNKTHEEIFSRIVVHNNAITVIQKLPPIDKEDPKLALCRKYLAQSQNLFRHMVLMIDYIHKDNSQEALLWRNMLAHRNWEGSYQNIFAAAEYVKDASPMQNVEVALASVLKEIPKGEKLRDYKKQWDRNKKANVGLELLFRETPLYQQLSKIMLRQQRNPDKAIPDPYALAEEFILMALAIGQPILQLFNKAEAPGSRLEKMQKNYQDAWALECAALTMLFDWCGELARHVESQIANQPYTQEKYLLLDFLNKCIGVRQINHHELTPQEAVKLTQACEALEKYCNYKKFKPERFIQTDFAKRILSEAAEIAPQAAAAAPMPRT